ncbi:MAG: hypothetical protein ACPLKQ_04545 [Candidatus Bathyarchaeales archaeon]
MNDEFVLLVGDNPFHGISHLSQERSRERSKSVTDAAYAASLVLTALENGADGFMFSVSETALSILSSIRERNEEANLDLYAIVPYAYSYVRLATQAGGVSGLAKKIAKEIVSSFNVKAMATGLKAALTFDLKAFLETYLTYEISRIRAVATERAKIKSVMLHEIITDMALALNLGWLFKTHIKFMLKKGIKPGFETRNFACLVGKFKEWGINFSEVTIATPFNAAGFQMNPSKEECEKALFEVGSRSVIAMSMLAAGYLTPQAAIDYIQKLPNLKGVVVGVSKERHASETFKMLSKSLR